MKLSIAFGLFMACSVLAAPQYDAIGTGPPVTATPSRATSLPPVETPAPPKEWVYAFHQWSGMQLHRGRALDTGVGAAICYGRWRLGGDIAQNRVGFDAGRKNARLMFVKDTRIGGIKDGWEFGLSFNLEP